MRSRITSWTIAGVLAGCAWSAVAHADQCAVLDKVTATRALDVLRRHPDIVMYCEPCGSPAPDVPLHVARAEGRPTGGGIQIVLDTGPIDLAYTYVRTSSHRYENLAALVACPTSGVSPSLAIDDATSTGVLIHADRTPVQALEPVAQVATPAPVPVQAAPAQAPPAQPPAQVIYIVAPSSSLTVGWDVVLLACLATAVAWWLGAGLRRRRTMRPRATEL